MKDFKELFTKELRDIYLAEKHCAEKMPELIKAISSPELKKLAEEHLTETRSQSERLERAAKELEIDLAGGQCDAVKCILNDAFTLANEELLEEVKDAAIINEIQRVKHYEIAAYGILKAFAKHLHYDNLYKLLDESAKEEGRHNKKLNELAEGSLFTKGINARACKRKAA